MEALKFDADGLLTAVAQDIETGQVLMVAMMMGEYAAIEDADDEPSCLFMAFH